MGFGSIDSRQQMPASMASDVGVNVSSTVNSAVNSIGGFLRNQFPTRSEVCTAHVWVITCHVQPKQTAHAYTNTDQRSINAKHLHWHNYTIQWPTDLHERSINRTACNPSMYV